MKTELELAELRRNYTAGALSEADTPAEPLGLLADWLTQAKSAGLLEPNAMFLATVSASGQPSGRVVLLKNLDTGLVFFTNYNSRKGYEIGLNQQVAATFFWDVLERQVRVEGIVEMISRAETLAYFNSRPKGSRIGAIVSPQSAVLPDRTALEQAFATLEKQPEESLVCPDHWGGYRIIPQYVEFWQGRPSRLHDRITYTKTDQQTWSKARLAP